jgi:hypothetical protein
MFANVDASTRVWLRRLSRVLFNRRRSITPQMIVAQRKAATRDMKRQTDFCAASKSARASLRASDTVTMRG